MNVRTTLLLAALLAAGAAGYHYRDDVARKLGTAPPPITTAGTLARLEAELKPERITRVEISGVGESVTLEKRGDAWSLPGGWPARAPEVQDILNVLGHLRSRFTPIPVTDDSAVSQYGLSPQSDPPPVTVKVSFTTGDPVTLRVGEVKGEGNPFTQPSYLRLDDYPEIVRLGPGVRTALTRPQSAYQRRRLFPDVARVRFGEANPVGGDDRPAAPPVLLLDAPGLKVTGPDGSWTLTRTATLPASTGPGPLDLTADKLAGSWAITAPASDRPDPDKLKSVLTAVPDLWAEQFVNGTDLASYGLQPPERTVEVQGNGRTHTLLIGKVSHVRETKGAVPPTPPSPFAPPPPPPPIIREEYRYAKLPDNPQVFEVKAERFADLFGKLADLRDAKLARFNRADVRKIEIAGVTPVTLQWQSADAWKIAAPFAADADGVKVNELIDKLAGLEARGDAVIDNADPKKFGLDAPTTRIALTLREGDKDRVVTFKFGKDDEAKKKLPVQLEERPRVNEVADDLVKLIARPALAYRGRKALDVAADAVTGIKVERPGESYTLSKTGATWALAEPVAIAAVQADMASKLANDLAKPEVVEFISETPTPEERAKYGLDKPAVKATLLFGNGQPARTLLFGNAREGRPELYAQLEGQPAVFAVRQALKEAADQPSLAYRPLDLWTTTANRLRSVSIQRTGQPAYMLTRDVPEWKLAGPFTADAPADTVLPSLERLASVRAERYESHKASDLKPFGLDAPTLVVKVNIDPAEAGGAAEAHELLIGRAVPNKAERFAKLAERDGVFTIADAILIAIDKPPVDWLNRKLVGFEPRAVVRIKLTGEKSWTLERRDGAWLITSQTPPVKADSALAERAATALARVTAVRVLAYNDAAAFTQAGLDKPTTTVELAEADKDGKPGAVKLIAIGNSAPNEPDSRTARVNSGPALVQLPASASRELVKSALDFADRKLWRLDGQVVAIRRQGEGGALELQSRDEGWQIVQPQPFKADDNTVEALGDRLAMLTADRIAAVGATDLKPFGLDQPVAVVTVSVRHGGTTSDKVLKLGAADPAGGRFAQVDGSDVVAVLTDKPGDRLAKKLLAPALAFRERLLGRFADADRVTLERGERKATFARVDGVWKQTEPIKGDAEAADLDDLINAVARLRAEELVAEKPADLKPFGLDRPEARWKFYDGERVVLEVSTSAADAEGQAFAQVAGSDFVAKLDGKLTGRLLGEYRKRSPWAANLDSARVDSLVISDEGKPPAIFLKPGNEPWSLQGQADATVDIGAVSKLLAALAGLKAERYITDDGADLALFGLDPAARTIVATPRGGASARIQLGRFEGETKKVYARVDGGDGKRAVFVIGVADAAELLRGMGELVRKK